MLFFSSISSVIKPRRITGKGVVMGVCAQQSLAKIRGER